MSEQSKSHDATAQFGVSANPARKLKKAQGWQDRTPSVTRPRDFPASRAP